MENLCIVPCGKRKIWDSKPNLTTVKAKCAYTGVFSLKCIEYAEKFLSGPMVHFICKIWICISRRDDSWAI